VWQVAGPGTQATAVYDLHVQPDGCYNADGDGPPAINGQRTLVAFDGTSFMNPLWEFDGCFGNTALAGLSAAPGAGMMSGAATADPRAMAPGRLCRTLGPVRGRPVREEPARDAPSAPRFQRRSSLDTDGSTWVAGALSRDSIASQPV
jgi:hypothetical protein